MLINLIIILILIFICLCLLYSFNDNSDNYTRIHSHKNSYEETSVEINFIQNYLNYNNNDQLKIKTNSTGGTKERKFNHYIPKYMLDLYEESRIIAQNDLFAANHNHPDIVKSIIPTNVESIDEIGNRFEKSHLLIFDIPVVDTNEIFVAAELRILTLIQNHPNSVLGVERIIHVSFYDYIDENIKHLDKRHVYHTNNTWISFNLTTAIKHLLTYNRTQQLKVVITIELYNKHNSKQDFPTISSLDISLLPISKEYHYEHDYPLLVLSYSAVQNSKSSNHENQNLRHKRDVDMVEEEYEEETNRVWSNDKQGHQAKAAYVKRMRRLRNSCRKHSLYINFADINYDTWIVQPTGYEAYQCAGKCFYPVADHLSPTKHAIIQSLLHSVKPQSAPRTCCVPTKLGPISVLYIDSRGILTYRYGYQEMVVLECGCR